MKRFIYEPIPEYDRATAIQEIESGVTERVTGALLALAFYDSDWLYVQNLCIEHAKNSNQSIRGTAILCFGHLARIHRKLQTEIAVPLVIEALQDSTDYVRGCADDTLEDLLIFCTSEDYERTSALEQLESRRIDAVLLALYAIAKHDVDVGFVQAKCIEYAHHPNQVIRGQALKGFATMVYEHRQIGSDQIMLILSEASKTDDYAGQCARAAIECIETYMQAADNRI